MGFLCVPAKPNVQVPFAVPTAVPSHRCLALGGHRPRGQAGDRDVLAEQPWPQAGYSRARHVFAAGPAQHFPHRLSTRIRPGAEHRMAALVFKHQVNTLCGK